MNSSDSINFVEKCINYINISKMSIDIFEGILQEERDSFSLGETKEMVSSADGVLLHASISTKYPRGWLQSFPALVCNSSDFPNISSSNYTPFIILKKIKNGGRMTYTSLKNFID